MWALAAQFERWQRAEWRRKFGTEFTGMHEGRPVRLTWREVTVGHVCVGVEENGGHLKCLQLVDMRWVWLRPKQGD